MPEVYSLNCGAADGAKLDSCCNDAGAGQWTISKVTPSQQREILQQLIHLIVTALYHVNTA